MNEIVGLLERHGMAVVFVSAFLEQIGAPITAIPIFIVAAAVAPEGTIPQLLALAVAGGLIADILWFTLGRRHGQRVLGLLCRISLSPDSCVRQTESFFERYGLVSLTFAKFVPGFSIVAPPLAGSVPGTSFRRFLFYDTIGAVFWAGASLAAGLIFRDAIDRLLDALERLGGWAGVILIGALLLFIFWKWYERQRFYQSLRIARISPAELRSRMDAGRPLVILDVRSNSAQKRNPRHIPGALMLQPDEMEAKLKSITPDQEIVLYCTWPNEASAARVARLLMDHGFTRVRPLEGGLEAWVSAGYQLA